LVVYFPAAIINALSYGGPFITVVIIAITFETVLMIIPMIEDVYNICIRDRALLRVRLSINKNVYEKVLRTDYKYIDNPKYYDKYTWAVNEYASKAEEALSLVNNFVSSLVVIVALIAVISVIGPWVLIIALLSIGSRTIAYIKTNKIDIKREEEFVPLNRWLDYIHRIFYHREYTADLKTTGLGRIIFGRYNIVKKQKIDVLTKYSKETIKWALFADVIFRVAECIIVIHIAHGIYTGNIASVGLYITLMLAVDQLINYIHTFFDLLRVGNHLSLHADKIREFYEMESEIEPEIELEETGCDVTVMPFQLQLKDVCFAYENSLPIIAGLSLDIKAGEKIAIVGENGVGKSTLVKLLLRLYDPLMGSISVNGSPIADYDIHKLRKQIGVAFQSPNIYALTLKENMELYDDNVTNDNIFAAIKLAGLGGIAVEANFEKALTREFDQDGIMLSGGNEQKVGLARLFTREFGLLILDEPSSALDPIAEYEMTKLLTGDFNRTTTIIIAHRLSSIRDVDRIAVMQGGRIKELGTHDELLKLNGVYCKMFARQAENYVK